MTQFAQNIIVGQGLAGSVVAWTLYMSGQSVVIVDRNDAVTASKVAAGLVTPLTGSRLARSPNFETEWKTAVSFYRRIEQDTGEQIFDESPMIRVFEDAVARTALLAKKSLNDGDEFEHWNGSLMTGGPDVYGIRMSPAGRLNVRAFLNVTRHFFETRSAYVQADVSFDNDVLLAQDRIELRTPAVTGQRLILCQGSQSNELFPGVPGNPSRGDILKVRIPDYEPTEVVHRSIWIAPESDGSQSVGATYDWKNLNSAPTPAGRTEILTKLHRLVEVPVTVLDHKAAVRPTMKDYQPVIGCHPQYANLFIFNGLGSKGTLRAPLMAQHLQNMIQNHQAPPANVNYARLLHTANSHRRPLTAMAQEIVSETVQRNDTVIDATVGNGFDTCFLAKAVGSEGRVIGFDVQECAITATQKRLIAGELNNVILRHESHENIAQLSEESVAAVMFNLGYLPRSDHSVITTPESSVSAIAAAIRVLKPDGVLTVLSYRGHEGGQAEFCAIECLLSGYASHYDLTQIHSTPARPSSPVLFVLKKTASHDK